MSTFTFRNLSKCCLFWFTCALGHAACAADDNPPAGTTPEITTLGEANILAIVDEARTDNPTDTENTADQPEAQTQEPDTIDPDIIARTEQDRIRYAQAITELENSTNQNIYNPELTEAYLNLAGTLEKLSLFDEATEVYNQALQTTRIGNGLNSLEQIPILERMLENNQTMQQWDAADSNAHLIFHIARRNFPAGDPRRISALDKLGKWKLKSAEQELLDGYNNDAWEALGLYDNELELLEDKGDHEVQGVQMAALHLGKARAALALASQTFARPISDYQTPGQQTITTQRCVPVTLADGRVIRVCETVEVPNLEYYLDPSLRKNQEISQHLEDIREGIVLAYYALQEDGDTEARIALLEEVQVLTNSYNTFVSDNSL